jgi:hypothetical protein
VGEFIHTFSLIMAYILPPVSEQGNFSAGIVPTNYGVNAVRVMDASGYQVFIGQWMASSSMSLPAGATPAPAFETDRGVIAVQPVPSGWKWIQPTQTPGIAGPNMYLLQPGAYEVLVTLNWQVPGDSQSMGSHDPLVSSYDAVPAHNIPYNLHAAVLAGEFTGDAWTSSDTSKPTFALSSNTSTTLANLLPQRLASGHVLPNCVTQTINGVFVVQEGMHLSIDLQFAASVGLGRAAAGPVPSLTSAFVKYLGPLSSSSASKPISLAAVGVSSVQLAPSATSSHTIDGSDDDNSDHGSHVARTSDKALRDIMIVACVALACAVAALIIACMSYKMTKPLRSK